MDSPASKTETRPLSLAKGFVYLLAAVSSFTLAYSFNALSFLIVVYLYCLISLARVKTSRQAFYFGLGVGMLAYPIQLTCFWTIFGPAAIALWFVLAFWLGLFVMLSRLCLVNFKMPWGALLIPFLWAGLEYFRSELYYLRFSWLNVGYVFSESAYCFPLKIVGMYGMGFVFVFLLCAFQFLKKWHGVVANFLLLIIVMIIADLPVPLGHFPKEAPKQVVRIAGVQFEFESLDRIIAALDRLAAKVPKPELFVLSEYTLTSTPPQELKDWCREHQKFLVVGGKEDAPNNNFYNTAFVIGTNGEVVFKQVKAVPIQFFKDGLPAPEQKLWESPWGKIGICICYDLSYTKVTDGLIKLGAEALIVPTMDVEDWGRRQHELHFRVAPVRAAEYGVGIFRVASSGISQWVHPTGKVRATAPFPGRGEMIWGVLDFGNPGTLPFDRTLAPFSVLITALIIIVLTAQTFWRKFRKKPAA